MWWCKNESGWLSQGLPWLPGLPFTLKSSFHSEDQEAEIHSKRRIVTMAIFVDFFRDTMKKCPVKKAVVVGLLTSWFNRNLPPPGSREWRELFFPIEEWGHPHGNTEAKNNSLLWKFSGYINGVVFIPAVFPPWKAGLISECLSGELEKIRTMTILE